MEKKQLAYKSHKSLFRFVCSVFLILVVTITSCKKDKDDEVEPAPVKTQKELVLEDYNANYVGSEVTVAELNWTGNSSACNAGAVSAISATKTLQRVNYFRRMAGLNDDITLDAAKSAKCQQAALMFKANGALDHAPPTTWSCYTADGYDAAANSNISSGSNSSYSVSRYIRDEGSGNTAVGHRRWILYSRAKVMGTGSTDNTNALWVLGNSGNPTPTTMPEFIAWPCKGYVPATLVYPRWSLGVPNADFTNAQVTMTDAAGNPVSLNVIYRNGGYGDKTIVWEPQNINITSSADVTYNVSVTNVELLSETKSYNYQVIIVQP